ncbi:alpha/beta hydrolase family protein [Aliiroseovarius sp. 2305UL8-7]|uniref:alpha/beta hydrolase family protein n=1 Tax=Aliiroseovarius conchicola TaxID=3121637 RepID=UPI003528F0EC
MGSVGYRTGLEMDCDRFDWDGATDRPLAWSAWYPVSTDDTGGNRPHGQFFDLGDVEVDRELADSSAFPVVLLSHGTGGSPESMGWLARRLAQNGYVVIGAHHHGNTGREPYRAEGFLCWWERALDLSALLSMLSEYGPFSGRLDVERVHAVGFSLGGYTALALAGARTSMDRYLSWASRSGVSSATGPREFPNVASHIKRLLESSSTFRKSWARQDASFKDERIRSITAIAPAPPVRAFDAESLQSISIPVTLISGEADTEAPSRDCADWLATINSRFDKVSIGQNVGHYTFLGFPTANVIEGEEFVFIDNPGVDREDVHEAVEKIVLDVMGEA